MSVGVSSRAVRAPPEGGHVLAAAAVLIVTAMRHPGIRSWLESGIRYPLANGTLGLMVKHKAVRAPLTLTQGDRQSARRHTERLCSVGLGASG